MVTLRRGFASSRSETYVCQTSRRFAPQPDNTLVAMMKLNIQLSYIL
jgi:hypothetical protein